MTFIKVANINDLKPGECKAVNVNGTEIALFNVDSVFHAVENSCPHKGGPLGEGILDGEIVSCPWHGWRFNVVTGNSPVMPTAHLKKFEVKVEGEDVLVNL
ncbi:MAG TPA: Rieske 2Fe-2S domain-containing protein [Candidatus Aenigmarchaeota archaeon]|nr:Rieske 2Fe-2S domain-containing protein [Candidatus Aenigmarchaeota archaeon]